MRDIFLEETEEVNCCVCDHNSTRVVSIGRDYEYSSVNDSFFFHRCNRCGHHFLNPRPSEKSLHQIYPPEYGNYSNSQRFSIPFAVKSKMEFFFLQKLFGKGNTPKSVLDVGCGDGRLLEIVQSISPPNSILEGIEISNHASKEARNKGFTITTGSIEHIDLQENKYDYIFMIQVIEHLHMPNESLLKLRHSLRKGGIIVVETPDTNCLDYRFFKKRYWGGYHYPRHFNLFEKGNLQKIVETAGLKVIHSGNKLQPVHWIWSFHHLLEDKTGVSFFSKSFNIKNPLWIILFTLLDAFQLYFFAMSSNQRLIAQKI